MRELSAPRERPVITAQTLAELLAEFQRPGEALHGLPQADAERIFTEAVEALLLNAVRQRALRLALN